jgi:hypothetical protein
MLKVSLALCAICCVTAVASAQESTFDVIAFVPPPGWTREARDSVLGFSIVDQKKGTYCQIGIWKSRPGSGSPQKDFEDEWGHLVASLNPAPALPAPQVDKAPDGWTRATASATFLQERQKRSVTLVTLSGGGKVTSIRITATDAGYQAHVDAFLRSVRALEPTRAAQAPRGTIGAAPAQPAAPAPATSAPQAARGSWDQIGFAAPRGWSRSETASGVRLTSPVLACAEGSVFTIDVLGVLPAAADPAQATAVHAALFPGGPRYPRMLRSRTAAGWPYVTRDDEVYTGSLFYGRVLLIDIGGRAALITMRSNGTSLDCPSLAAAWKSFVDSISIKDARPPEISPAAAAEDLVGRWESRILSGVGSGGVPNSQLTGRQVFVPDGSWNGTSPSGTAAGTWRIEGGKLAVTDAAGGKQVYTYRVDGEFAYGSWSRRLTMTDADGQERSLIWQGPQ